MPRPRAAGPPPRPAARSPRRTRWPGGPSRPWPPTAGPAARRDPASRRTAATSPAARPSPRRATSDSTQRAHAVPLVRDHPGIAVRLVDGPRHDGRGVGPAGAAEPQRLRRAPRPARRSARRSTGSCSSARSREPAPPERLGVEQRGARRHEGLRVARPAEPLVALRAVRGHGHEVVPLRPRHVLVQPVQRAVAALERRAPRGVTADRHDLGVEELRLRLDLGVLEPVERERRLEHGHGVVREHPRVGRPGAPQRAQVERPVRLQDLGVPDRDDGPPRPAHGQPDVARDVLPAVEQRPAGSALEPRGRAGRR